MTVGGVWVRAHAKRTEVRACTAASRRRWLRRWRTERLDGGRSAGHTLHARRDRGGGGGRGPARRRCGLGALGGVPPRVVDGDAIEAGVAAQQVVSCLAPDCPVLVGLCRETPARVEPEPCLQRVRQAGSL